MTHLLSQEQVTEFDSAGLLVLPGFFDVQQEIEPIQRGIYGIVGLLIEKYGLAIERTPFSAATFDDGYQQLIAADRAYGAEVYDAVKQIPAFIRLVSSARLEALVCQLRATPLAGVAAGGYGIRIDNPGEERFRAPWHQEYPAQLRSLDGVVFWSPLMAITDSLGPVAFCPGSHKEGPLRVHRHDESQPDKTGAYALRLEREAEVTKKYAQVAPLTRPGDLVAVDFLLVHASGQNTDTRSRWAMQLRYLNFHDPTGVKIGWRGSFAAGTDFATVHPELVVD